MNEEGNTSANHKQAYAARESVTAAIVSQSIGGGRRLPRRGWPRLTAADWRLVGTVALAQIVAAAALCAIPLPAVRVGARRLRPLARFFVRGADDRIAWAIEATGRRLHRLSTCLVRALVGELVFDSQGGPVSLTIGVRRTAAGIIEAHAWIARGDCVILGATSDEYIPLVTWTRMPA
jgi:hypothetical protein